MSAMPVERDLGFLERRIENSLSTAYADLAEIRDRKLYRAAHDTFEAYCLERWNISRSRAYRLIDAAEVVKDLEAKQILSPIGDKPTESQVRPLIQLHREERAPAYKEAVERSAGKPTAKVVQQVVDERIGKTRLNGVVVADPPEIAAKRAAGKIAPETVVEIQDLGEMVTTEDIAEEIEERAGKIDELDDDEWLDSLPLRTKLAGQPLKTFERDALLYRQIEGARKSFRIACQSPLKRHRRTGALEGAFAFSLSRFLRSDHPRDWKLCPTSENGGCAGSGSMVALGLTCNKCFGRGYWI